jgi:hypothetical protein
VVLSANGIFGDALGLCSGMLDLSRFEIVEPAKLVISKKRKGYSADQSTVTFTIPARDTADLAVDDVAGPSVRLPECGQFCDRRCARSGNSAAPYFASLGFLGASMSALYSSDRTRI